MLSERVCTAELSNFAEGASKSPRQKQSRLSHKSDFWFAFLWRDASIGWRFMMLLNKSPPQLRLVFLRAASKTTRAFLHRYTSLESFLKAKWQMMQPPTTSQTSTHVYEVRPRADHSGVDLISDVLPFGPLWYTGPNAISNAIKYAKSSSRSHDAVIRVFDGAGNVIETHEQAGDLFKPRTFASTSRATRAQALQRPPALRQPLPRPHSAEATVSCGLIPRSMFTTGRTLVFTARQRRANT
jgi:hypothetical protein